MLCTIQEYKQYGILIHNMELIVVIVTWRWKNQKVKKRIDRHAEVGLGEDKVEAE